MWDQIGRSITDVFTASKFHVEEILNEGSAKSILVRADEVIGAVTFWEPDTIEYQFTSTSTGECCLIETLVVVDQETAREQAVAIAAKLQNFL